MKFPKIQKRKPRKSNPPTVAIDIDGLDGGRTLTELRESVNIAQMRDELEIDNGHADLRWKRAYYGLRTIWGYLTIALLAVSLWFTYWLVKNVGKGTLNFTQYKSFLNIIAGTLIVDVLGLVAIVMHFLFPGEPKGK